MHRCKVSKNGRDKKLKLFLKDRNFLKDGKYILLNHTEIWTSVSITGKSKVKDIMSPNKNHHKGVTVL